MSYKVILLLLTLLPLKSALAQEEEKIGEGEHHHCLFEEKSFTLGIGLPYSLHLNQFGINARAYYNLGEQICFGPEFSFFKGEEEVYDFNFAGHYIFETKIVGIYPLIGVNYTIEKAHDEREEAFGIILGGGIHRNFKFMTIFAEYSHVLSVLKDDFLTVGLMFSIRLH